MAPPSEDTPFDSEEAEVFSLGAKLDRDVLGRKQRQEMAHTIGYHDQSEAAAYLVALLLDERTPFSSDFARQLGFIWGHHETQIAEHSGPGDAWRVSRLMTTFAQYYDLDTSPPDPAAA